MLCKLGELLKGGPKMTRVKAQLSVFFEDPFWIGTYERMEENRIEACRIIFGSEPKDYEVYSFLNNNWKSFKFIWSFSYIQEISFLSGSHWSPAFRSGKSCRS